MKKKTTGSGSLPEGGRLVLGELGGGEWRSRPAGEAHRCRRSLRISPKAKGGSAVGV